MRDDLTSLLEQADLAIASCAGIIEGERLDTLIDQVRIVRARLSYPEETLVVALAGGTGSGKSSLFNALVGEELAEVGAIRPTTSEPMAAIPASSGSSLDGYLDILDVTERRQVAEGELCLIDLPDTDSLDAGHRHRVEAILPLVDLVIWVVDPEKYRDARLHDEYLKPMAAYSAQLVFVLNQVDRLSETNMEEILNDLEAALEEDWLDEAVIVAVAAAPPAGPPVGLEDLRRVLEQKRADRSTLYRKLLTDLTATSRDLASAAGTGLDFDNRSAAAVTEASAALVRGDTSSAVTVLTDLMDILATEAGGPTASKLGAIAADVPGHIRRIEDGIASSESPRPRGWLRRTRVQESFASQESVSLLLSEAIIRPARAVLAARAVAVASVGELAVATESLRSKLPR